ncbi:hypothetical protein UFOVP1419_44 [uncultured Caudovirales phage]|uniref:Uncharacterized protein n=1 Tax=uncultured Caudovirales phage TaxID=2100421 RepID=A0A6J5SE41_9CAUD|nr:hypothetical protein UFOVP1419_44 [uncultured Caudovirales phage]
MAVIKISQFKGMAPKVAPRMLPDGVAQTATNCVFGSGSLRPLAVPLSVVAAGNASLQTGVISSLFKYGSYWLNWVAGQDVDVCRSSVALDVWDRLYWTGDTSGIAGPKMADNTKLLGGAGPKPQSSWPLGIPKPTSAPVAAYSGAAPTSIALARRYAYCYRSFCGEEGPLSDASNIVSLDDGVGSVALSGMGSAPPTGYGNIIEKIIYRSNTGSSTTVWQLVAVIAIATATYSDTKLAADVQEVCPSETWIAPNVAMKGLVSHPGGFLCGFYDNVLCFSEAYLPHAWPAAYQMQVDNPIVALGVFGNSLLVVTTGMPYVVTGGSPASLSPPEKLERGEACLNKRSFVDVGYACAWAGPSGLWLASTGSVLLVTENILKPADWQALLTSIGAAGGVGLIGAQYGSTYVGFGTTGAFIFDAATGDYATTDIAATAQWYDQTTATLYLVVGGAVVSWNSGATKKQLVWKSRPERLQSPDTMGVLQLFAGSYSPPPTVKVFADGVQIQHKGVPYVVTVTSDEPVNLPGGYTANATYEVEVTSSVEIVPPLLMASCLLELG